MPVEFNPFVPSMSVSIISVAVPSGSLASMIRSTGVGASVGVAVVVVAVVVGTAGVVGVLVGLGVGTAVGAVVTETAPA